MNSVKFLSFAGLPNGSVSWASTFITTTMIIEAMSSNIQSSMLYFKISHLFEQTLPCFKNPVFSLLNRSAKQKAQAKIIKG